MRTLSRIAIIALMVSAVALGQGGRGGGGRSRGGDMGAPMRMGANVKAPIDVIADQLKLNKDQKKDVKNILDEAQKEANPLRDQIAKSRVTIGEAIAAGKTGDDLNQLTSAEGALEAQMAMLEMNAFAKVYQSLDSEQKNLTRSLFPMMKGMFLGKNWNSLDQH